MVDGVDEVNYWRAFWEGHDGTRRDVQDDAILDALKPIWAELQSKRPRVLDLGCGDGTRTALVAAKLPKTSTMKAAWRLAFLTPSGLRPSSARLGTNLRPVAFTRSSAASSVSR